MLYEHPSNSFAFRNVTITSHCTYCLSTRAFFQPMLWIRFQDASCILNMSRISTQEDFIHFKVWKPAQCLTLLLKSSTEGSLHTNKGKDGLCVISFPLSSKNSPTSRSPGPTFPRQRCSFTALRLLRGRGVEDRDGKCYPAADFPHKLQQP